MSGYITYLNLEEGTCRTSLLNIPEDAKFYSIQTKGFHYGGKVPRLYHYYSVKPDTTGYMKAILLETPPTIIDIKDDEVFIEQSAEYHGILTERGKKEYFERPIIHYYSPPLVDIVSNKDGDVRAIVVDASYAIYDYEQPILQDISSKILNLNENKQYSQANDLYHKFCEECIKIARQKGCNRQWRIKNFY